MLFFYKWFLNQFFKKKCEMTLVWVCRPAPFHTYLLLHPRQNSKLFMCHYFLQQFCGIFFSFSSLIQVGLFLLCSSNLTTSLDFLHFQIWHFFNLSIFWWPVEILQSTFPFLIAAHFFHTTTHCKFLLIIFNFLLFLHVYMVWNVFCLVLEV